MSGPSILNDYDQINPFLVEIQPKGEAKNVENVLNIIDRIPFISTLANIALLAVAGFFLLKHSLIPPQTISSGLEFYIVNQRSKKNYLIGLIPFAGLAIFAIQSVRSVHEAQPKDQRLIGTIRTQTYENARLNSNCDYIQQTRTGGLIHLDGVGHDNSKVVEEEHRLVDEFSQDWENWIETFDFKAPHALSTFLTIAHHKFLTFNNEKMCTLLETRNKNFLNYKQNVQDEKIKFNLNKNMSLEEFQQLRGDLDLSKINRKYLRRRRGESDSLGGPDLKEKFWNEVYKAIIDNDYNAYIEKLSSLNNLYDLSVIREKDEVDREMLKLMEGSKDFPLEDKAGSAFAVTQPLPIDEGYIFFRNLADTCLLVLSPKTEWDQIQLNLDGSLNLGTANIQWVEETGAKWEMASYGSSNPQFSTGLNLLGPYPKGAIAISFTDGIGEFLTKDEIAQCVAKGLSKGSVFVNDFLMEEIRKYEVSQDGKQLKNGNRSMASKSRSVPCKNLDILDPSNHDDVSFGITYLPSTNGLSPLVGL